MELHPVQVRHPRPPRFLDAATFEQAVAALADPDLQPARIVAGGTDLLLEIERGVRTGIRTLVDVTRISGADAVELAEHGDGDGERATAVARLGPTVTHNQVVAHPTLIARALPLAQACWEIGSPQLRNRATVAGNLITASPANDTISALLAMGASVELTSVRGVRSVPLESFFDGFRSTVMADDELLTAVEVPLLDRRRRGIYAKLGNRSAQAISVVHLAVVVALGDDGAVTDARLALGSVAPTVVLAEAAAAALVGRPLDDTSIAAAADAAAAGVSPIDDVRATAEYRSDTVAVMVRRALRALADGREAERFPSAPVLLAGPPEVEPRHHAVPTPAIGPDDEITATVNGHAITASGAVGATLLEWLRDEVGATGTKEGCAEGECGACTVLLDGRAVMSCLVPAAHAAGREIVTSEGLADGDRLHPVQQAFVDTGAVQCGFCTPGFVVSAARLLDEHPTPTTDQIHQALAGNLCRCTGYTTIVEAVERASGAGR